MDMVLHILPIVGFFWKVVAVDMVRDGVCSGIECRAKGCMVGVIFQPRQVVRLGSSRLKGIIAVELGMVSMATGYNIRGVKTGGHLIVAGAGLARW